MYINAKTPTTIIEFILKDLEVVKSIPFKSIAFA
jgi:hypothetical protein